MRGKIKIEPGYENLFGFIDPQRPFESVSEYFGFPLGRDQRRRSKVTRKLLRSDDGEEVGVFFKLYGYRRLRRALSRLLKPTRSQAEIVNLKFFHELGIPACEPLLQGVYLNAVGMPRNCMLITKEVKKAQQLDLFIQKLHASDQSNSAKKDMIYQILGSLAHNLRKIHQENFCHDDFKWRNILVRRAVQDASRIEVFWIDCPNGYFDKSERRYLSHGKIKDLAAMDYDAQKYLSRAERMIFLSMYSGYGEGSAQLDDLAEKVSRYRRLRYDDN